MYTDTNQTRWREGLTSPGVFVLVTMLVTPLQTPRSLVVESTLLED